LVERNLAKVEVESSRLFSRSSIEEGQPCVAALFALYPLRQRQVALPLSRKSVGPAWAGNAPARAGTRQ
jgi:hypothetical protein